MRFIDRTGQIHWGITFLEKAGRNKKNNRILWLCECHCGNKFKREASQIVSGKIKSCGCRQQANYRKLKGKETSSYIHGDTGKRLHRIWSAMRSRCNCSYNTRYEHYGGRGIAVCEEWNNSYIVFREWALNNGYADDLSIDRIDVDGNYEPSNCRWATTEEQAVNRTLQSNNTSGVRGVTFVRKQNKWQASIKIKGKFKHLGIFSDKSLAIKARQEGDLYYWGKETQDYKALLEEEEKRKNQEPF